MHGARHRTPACSGDSKEQMRSTRTPQVPELDQFHDGKEKIFLMAHASARHLDELYNAVRVDRAGGRVSFSLGHQAASLELRLKHS